MTAPAAEKSFEAAQDRTLYWTLSFYIRPERLWQTRHPGAGAAAIPAPFRRERVAEMQQAEPVSLALRDAIEPLFNDISDRESGGRAVDYLLAAEPGESGQSGETAARDFIDIEFHPPESVRWTTEGRRYSAKPKGLSNVRPARMRRFWFVHADGAVSWHLGLTLGYHHDPADYLFLAMLQKLAAPKEFALNPARAGLSVFSGEDSGIDPLDELQVSVEKKARVRFWPMVGELFRGDAISLIERLASAHECTAAPYAPLDLLDLTGLIEVPGLLMPRCRTMMYFRDARFFERLSPKFDEAGNRVPRRMLVQDRCYAPYAERLEAVASGAGSEGVVLGDGEADSFWDWVRRRPEYEGLSAEDLAAIREGRFRDPAGQAVHIPAFEPGRADCLDYLFLSGFNQNIIDFMNQDTSEILDGTDPIYPTDEDQAREGFFVRFANHRSMVTYAARSRSLEVGNDYIGTCPYAFLVHVLSMHNEFLARDFETRALDELAEIEQALASGGAGQGFARHSQRINALKIARYRDYEQHRYVNVFRYDTERDLFAELEQLRGVQRKETALELALESLEDHAADLEGQRAGERDRNIGAIAFVLSTLALAQGLVIMAEFSERFALVPWARLLITEGLWWLSAILLGLLMVASVWIVVTRRKAIGELLASGSKGETR